MTSKNTYLADIDGLRAISVVAVVLYHFFPQLGGAGYLGVDAFFVISGFVITASLQNYPTPDGFQSFLARFYLRRIRRLLPALMFVVLVTTIVAVLIISRSETSMKTGAFSIIGLANIYLYSESLDYFAISTELNPFTHMWSLAVEDQFYLIFPIVIWFLGDRVAPVFNARRLFAPLIAVSTISLIGFVVLFSIDYPFAFYMMPARLWQIGLGILAYIATNQGWFVSTVKKVPLGIPVAGMLIVFATANNWILPAHILIAVFTAMALACIGLRSVPSPVLSSPPITYIGKISYSLYLWHWPTVVLLKHSFGITPLSIALCLIATVLMAMFSYHCIETPFRHTKPLPAENKLVNQFRFAAALSIAFFAFILITFPRFSNSSNTVLAQAFDVPQPPEQTFHMCHGKVRTSKMEDPLKECLGSERTRDTPNKIFLLGDSHANHLIPMLEEVTETSPYSINFVNFESRKHGIQSLTRLRGVLPSDFQYARDNAMPGDIVMISFHRGRLNKNKNWNQHLPIRQHVTSNEKTENLIGNLTGMFDTLSKRNTGILLALDTPLMASVTPSETCALQITLAGESVCKITKLQDLQTRWRQDHAFSELKNRVPAVTIWDPAMVLYEDSDSFEVLDHDGDYLMYDWSHVTAKTLQQLKPGFKRSLDEVLQKLENSSYEIK